MVEEENDPMRILQADNNRIRGFLWAVEEENDPMRILQDDERYRACC